MSLKKLLPIILITAVSLAVFILWLYRPKPQPQASTVPFPQPSFTPFSQLPTPSPEIQFNLQPHSQSVDIYRFQPSSSESMAKINKIVSALDLTTSPQTITMDNQPYLHWQTSRGYFLYNQHSGSFNFKVSPFPSTTIINAQTAEDLTTRWLTDLGLYLNSTTIVIPLADHGHLETAAADEDPDAFMVNYSPAIGNLPIFHSDPSQSPITITITSSGQIIAAFYSLPVHFYSTNTAYTASPTGTPTINSIVLSNGQYLISTATVNSVTYTQSSLGYLVPAGSEYLQPVFKLTGTGFAGGQSATITAFSPAFHY